MVGRWLVLSSRRVYYHARASVVPLFKRALREPTFPPMWVTNHLP